MVYQQKIGGYIFTMHLLRKYGQKAVATSFRINVFVAELITMK
jgi:hypothetical protein